jgi:hypothetical protein
MNKEINLIIFSKDRPLQLDSLLRSIKEISHIPYKTISLLYKYSSKDFQRGYEKLINRNIISSCKWIQEASFSNDLCNILNTIEDNSLIMFLVDDDIFFNTFALDDVLSAFSDKHLFISLRASRKYETDVQPDFINRNKYLEWKWNYSRKKPVTWNYPFSIDGNIFHVSTIKKIVHKISFTAPNSFEGSMHIYRHKWWIKRIKLALTPLEAVVVNNPLNRVQTEGSTWNRNLSVDSLNRKYLEGYQIDNNVFYTAAPTSIHYPMDIIFKKI